MPAACRWLPANRASTLSVLHSSLSRTLLYAAEHLIRASVAAAAVLVRDDSFHAETALPASERAELTNYALLDSHDRKQKTSMRSNGFSIEQNCEFKAGSQRRAPKNSAL